MTHKDLDERSRAAANAIGISLAMVLAERGQSLAIGREAMINAYDSEAERLASDGED